jgi:hypothetical protein
MMNFIRLKGVVRELQGIRAQLLRIADCLEMDLAEKGFHVRVPQADTTGPEPTFEYVDEEMDWARENIPQFDRLSKKESE